MKSSFIKEYIFGIIQAIIWIVIGTLSILLVQQNTELYMQILVIAADIVLVAAAELGLTFMKNKRMPDQYEVKGNAQMLQQGNREQAAVVRQQVNPLDQVPISAQKKGMPAMARISYVALIGEQGNELLKWSLEGRSGTGGYRSVRFGNGTDDIKTACSPELYRQRMVCG